MDVRIHILLLQKRQRQLKWLWAQTRTAKLGNKKCILQTFNLWMCWNQNLQCWCNQFEYLVSMTLTTLAASSSAHYWPLIGHWVTGSASYWSDVQVSRVPSAWQLLGPVCHSHISVIWVTSCQASHWSEGISQALWLVVKSQSLRQTAQHFWSGFLQHKIHGIPEKTLFCVQRPRYNSSLEAFIGTSRRTYQRSGYQLSVKHMKSRIM